MTKESYRKKADNCAVSQKIMPDVIKAVKEHVPYCTQMIFDDLAKLAEIYGSKKAENLDKAAEEQKKRLIEKAKKASYTGA